MGQLDGMCMAVTLRNQLSTLRELFVEGNQLRDRGAEYMFRLLCTEGNSITLMSLAPRGSPLMATIAACTFNAISVGGWNTLPLYR